MHITTVATNDAEKLTSIAMLAKAHWGYDKSFMLAVREELKVSTEKLDCEALFYRCMRNTDGDILAFYCVDSRVPHENDNVFELDGLFTHPDWIGKGLGQLLFVHACDLSRRLRADKLLIQSDPYAVGFYQKMGCEIIGEKASGSIAGRVLPMMVKRLR